MIAACGAGALEPPRLATQTAAVLLTPTPPGTPHISLVPTATVDPDFIPQETEIGAVQVDNADVITVWINESPEIQGERLNKLADNFVDKTGIGIDLVLVAPELLPEFIQTAVVSDTLPDVVVHPFEYSPGWVADGILDASAATSAIDRLGRDTFDSTLLELINLDDVGTIPAIPSDGWQQLILYRTDWFSEADLETPDSYEAILTAAETIFVPDSIVTGIVVPTDSALISTQQAFEHIAASNGCELVKETGEITILHPACLEALEFYRSLINQFSPVGVQTDISTLNAYLAGRTGLIFSSPAALTAIAGYSKAFEPSCPLCSTPGYLAENTGILIDLSGSGEFAKQANFGTITSLGITTSANNGLANAFVDYWFDDGYSDWIAIAPERRVPMRLGTIDSPGSFIDDWIHYPIEDGGSTLADIYGLEIVEKLSQGIASSSRWGIPEKQGELITTMHRELLLPPLLQEMLSGYFTSSQSVIEMYLAIIDLIPSYDFPIEIAPTEEP